MWLLDVNMPNNLTLLLREFGVDAETARSRAWDTLNNGRLVETAASAGFSCLLTRDRLFGQSASRALRKFPRFSVVVVSLPQLRAQQFVEAFRSAWDKAPVVPVPGHMIVWPL